MKLLVLFLWLKICLRSGKIDYDLGGNYVCSIVLGDSKEYLFYLEGNFYVEKELGDLES